MDLTREQVFHLIVSACFSAFEVRARQYTVRARRDSVGARHCSVLADNTPSEAVALPSAPGDLTSAPVSFPSAPEVITSAPVYIPSAPLVITSAPAELGSAPVLMASAPDEVPSAPSLWRLRPSVRARQLPHAPRGTISPRPFAINSVHSPCTWACNCACGCLPGTSWVRTKLTSFNHVVGSGWPRSFDYGF
jgi:hypothetical protein